MNTNETNVESLQVFSSKDNFELAQRIGLSLSKSSLVPKEYQGNMPNVLIALEMANRIGASPLMVMQHLYIVHGKPSWSSTFIIAAINTCGRFEPLQFKMEGEGLKQSCVAFAKEKKSGILCESPKITMEMAKLEGWIDKSGSKWKTMPELMLRYRAAAFFGRLYAPEVTMGMQSAEEVADTIANTEANSSGRRFEEEEVQDAVVLETTATGTTAAPTETEVPASQEGTAEQPEAGKPEPEARPEQPATHEAAHMPPPEQVPTDGRTERFEQEDSAPQQSELFERGQVRHRTFKERQ